MASKKEDKMFMSLKVELEKAASYCEDMAELYLKAKAAGEEGGLIQALPHVTAPFWEKLERLGRGEISRGEFLEEFASVIFAEGQN